MTQTRMRKPVKTPPLKVWQNDFYRVELHKQKIGYVLWAYYRPEHGPWEWGAYEDRADAEREVVEYYGFDDEESM